MKRIFVIGIGSGDPEQVTIQAVNAMNRVDVFFILDKGPSKAALIELRKEICRRFVTSRNHRFVEADSPEWDRSAADYFDTVEDLNRAKQSIFERFIAEDLAEDEVGAFLVWGDPAVYDSTIRNLETVAATGKIVFEFEVIPGISSIQALAAAHKTTLSRIGRSVAITTGRRLAQDFTKDLDSAVVMLDARDSYRTFVAQDVDIFWGAYVGTPDQILISGRLSDIADKIQHVRAEAKRIKGWIMDVYLMRRTHSSGE